MISFLWHKFSDLTVDQLYAILTLRSEIFVVEQRCPYLDPDGRDIFAVHLLGMEEDGTLTAYLRLFPPDDTQKHITFGRLVTARSVRNKGYGKKLLHELLTYCNVHFPGIDIRCSAQHHLIKFYAAFGFIVHGEIYDEDGIPHIAMEKISK